MTRHASSEDGGDYRLKNRDRRDRCNKKTPEPTQKADWTTTHKPSRHDAGWLKSSLGTFFEMGLITDVLFHVQAGKEASVYCCRAADGGLLAAKVYRPRKFRQLRNDKLYRAGREVLAAPTLTRQELSVEEATSALVRMPSMKRPMARAKCGGVLLRQAMVTTDRMVSTFILPGQ